MRSSSFSGLLGSLVLLSVLLFADDSKSSTDKPKATAMSGPPPVRTKIVEEKLHGQTIRDPYRWLEDANSAETQQFVRDQLAYTRSILDPLPGREEIHRRLAELLTIGSIGAPRPHGPWFFYTRRDGKQNQPVLYVRQGLNGRDRVLVDVNALAADGTVALDWWHPSHDGKYVAYGTSPNGSEISMLQLIDTATGKLLDEHIDRTRAASIAWLKDDSGFYYTKYPNPGDVPKGEEMYNRHVFYHQLGKNFDGNGDTLIFGEGLDPQHWPNIQLSDDDQWLLIDVSAGWSKSELFLKDLQKDAASVRITPEKEFLYGGEIYKGQIYIVTNEDAPRYRVFKVDVGNPQRANWREIVKQTPGERDAVLQNASVVGGKLLVSLEKDAISRLHFLDLEGRPLEEVRLPGLGNVTGLGGNYDSDHVFYNFVSFTQPNTVFHIDAREVNETRAKMSSNLQGTLWAKVDAPMDPSGYEVKQVFYTSKDGTKVPMFIVAKKGVVLNGRNPTLLTGYGGFNISRTPAFSGQLFLWLEHGGVYADANMRGGAEYGEAWHRAGMLGKKQNVFDDFIAAAEYLMAMKYADRDHLAIRGGSNGGLLVGAAFTQRPDLFKAVICQVPLLDMLRYQNFLIAKLWIPEYGSAEDRKQFDWLYAYSPYHHVKPGTEYPAILFMTADSDTRVDPSHAKKMAALMQAQVTNGKSKEKPILLRIEPKAGHGVGKPITKLIEEYTDVYSFLFWQLGVK